MIGKQTIIFSQHIPKEKDIKSFICTSSNGLSIIACHAINVQINTSEIIQYSNKFYPKPFSWECSTPVLFWIRWGILKLNPLTIPLYPTWDSNVELTYMNWSQITSNESDYFAIAERHLMNWFLNTISAIQFQQK